MGRSKMSLKIFLVSSFLIALCAGQHANPADLDPLDEINEDEFEEYFHVDRPEDPEEYEKRKEALKENEKEIHEINEEFEAGDISWFDAVNEFSDLPATTREPRLQVLITPTRQMKILSRSWSTKMDSSD